MATKQSKYIVTFCDTGMWYLQGRKVRVDGLKYRWGKTQKERATIFSSSAARSAVKTYGGKMVKL
jgi:hypothetical protein